MSAGAIIAQGIAETLAAALPKAIELVGKAIAGHDVTDDARQLAADTAYKLTSQQVHLTEAERDIPGFRR